MTTSYHKFALFFTHCTDSILKQAILILKHLNLFLKLQIILTLKRTISFISRNFSRFLNPQFLLEGIRVNFELLLYSNMLSNLSLVFLKHFLQIVIIILIHLLTGLTLSLGHNSFGLFPLTHNLFCPCGNILNHFG